MIDIPVETLRAVIFLAIVALLWRKRDRFEAGVRRPMLAGFGLLFLASLLDVSDNFPALNSLVFVGDTPLESFLEKVIGYLLGTLLIFIGLLRFEPVSSRLQTSLRELQTSRDRFQLAMEGSSGGYWDWIDPEHCEDIWLSDRLYELLGYQPGEFPATLSWFREAVHPEDAELLWSSVDAHLNKREPYNIVYRLKTKSGEYRWFRARGQASWDMQGKPTRMSGSLEDITDRKHYQYAINHLISGVATRTGHSYLESLALGLSELFGIDHVAITVLDDKNEGSLHSVALITEGLITENIVWPLKGSPGADVLKSGTACTYRSRVRDKFPNDRVLQEAGVESCIGIPLFATDGHPLGLMMLMDRQHISEDLLVIEIAQLFADRAVAELERIESESELILHREHLEDLVAYRTDELHRANQELESFSYSVSHDLRAPLRAIDGFSESLSEDYADQLDDTARDYIQRVRKNVRRMTQLIDDLLILSRVTRKEIEASRIDLSALCHEVIEQLRSAQPERAVQFEIEDAVSAWGDPGLIRIVMGNLLSNAWKYTSKASDAKIGFSATRENGITTYKLQDNGVGFDMKYAGKLFEVFQRLHGKDEFEGTGVGLATVKRAINRHHGSIWTKGEQGKGASFFFTLPEEPAAH